VKQFIYASSGSVYGVSEEAEVRESLPLVPLSDYNRTKMVAERAVLSYSKDMIVQVLRPADRRRLFFVSLSSSKRTMDGQASFMSSDNLVVNFTELADLPEILDRSLREFNELYKDFNAALNLAAI
jgi:dTDP-4-dehydrorhamnose reductase